MLDEKKARSFLPSSSRRAEPEAWSASSETNEGETRPFSPLYMARRTSEANLAPAEDRTEKDGKGQEDVQVSQAARWNHEVFRMSKKEKGGWVKLSPERWLTVDIMAGAMASRSLAHG